MRNRPAKRKNQICPVCWKIVYKPILARKNIYVVRKFVHEECFAEGKRNNLLSLSAWDILFEEPKY